MSGLSLIENDSLIYNKDMLNSKDKVVDIFLSEKILFIIRTDNLDDALRTSDVLVESGAKIIEFTSTVPNFSNAIKKAKIEYSLDGIIVGAGTVLNKEIALEAIEGEPDFLVNPIQNFDVLKLSKYYNKTILMGGFTPTEIYNTWAAGADFVKIFPASTLGVRFIHSLKKGPLPFVRVLASGGINLEIATEYIEAGADIIGLGSEVCKMEWIKYKEFEKIKETAKQYIQKLKLTIKKY